MITPTISIIIINYKTPRLTLDCLRSVLADKNLDFYSNSKNTKTPAEIILIDNNSSDDSTNLFKKFIRDKKLSNTITLIENKSNLGFGAANNQGLKIAKGNYILLLNSDTIILHSAISQSLDWLSSHPESLMCTAQLLNPDKTIQASGGYFPTLSNISTWSLSLDDLPFINSLVKPYHPHTPAFYTHDKFYTTDRTLDWLTGAFILIRKEALNTVKGFDETYHMYGEEVDLAYRLHLAYPKSSFNYLVGPQIIHIGRASSQNSKNHLLREYQGVIRFFQKHRPVFQLPILRFLLKINCLTHQITSYLLGNREQINHYRQIWSEI